MIILPGNGKPATTGHFNPGILSTDPCRQGPTDCIIQTQLTVRIIAPGPERAVVLDTHGMGFAADNHGPVGIGRGRKGPAQSIRCAGTVGSCHSIIVSAIMLQSGDYLRDIENTGSAAQCLSRSRGSVGGADAPLEISIGGQ